MKVLLIGGTGTISTEISKLLIAQGHDLYLINRGNKKKLLDSNKCNYIICDINQEDKVNELLQDIKFDVVADFIAFLPEHLERDYRLFKDKTSQFIFISSASAYQKPLSDYRINEGTPLSNPYWEYSRNKIECEDYLTSLYRNEGFPVTIVRPSHTYDIYSVPLGVHGEKGSWQVIKRMMEGKQVIIQGDGTSLWTMTHARDFAKGFVGLIGNKHTIGEAVGITSDESLTWNQIYEIIASALGVKLNAYHVSSSFLDACSNIDFNGSLIGDKSNTVVFDNSKLKRLVSGFCATIRFDEGVKEVIDNVKKHPEYQCEDKEFDSWCDAVIKAQNNAIASVLDD